MEASAVEDETKQGENFMMLAGTRTIPCLSTRMRTELDHRCYPLPQNSTGITFGGNLVGEGTVQLLVVCSHHEARQLSRVAAETCLPLHETI
eukprot:SAG31_NODE_123_length_23712_cov_41.426291_18_plen_92_part_00